MDNEGYKIAVASSDGIVVNNHFGKARKFYIYQVDSEERIRLIGERIVTPVCEGGVHDDEKLVRNLKNIKDCKYLLVSRIGDGASQMAQTIGIESYEIPGMIEESIKQLIKYVKIKKLFD